MHLKVSGQIQTDFIKVVNQPTIGFNVSSTAAWAIPACGGDGAR